MGKKIATVLTDMFEDVEYTEPAEAFKDAGHEVVTIEKEEGLIGNKSPLENYGI